METKNLRINEDAFLKLSKRKKILEEGKGHFTGYPSIDMPWLKFYSEEEIMCPLPNMSAYDYIRILNKDNLHKKAITCGNKSITYSELFTEIENTAKMLKAYGVKKGEVVTMNLPASAEEVFLFYALDKIGAVANYVIAGTPINSIVDNMNELNSRKYFTQQVTEKDAKYILENLNNDKVVVIDLASNRVFKKRSTNHNVNPYGMPKINTLKRNFKNQSKVKSERNQDDTLFIAKTGGSTGIPKNVLISDRSFNMVAHQFMNSSLDYNAGDKWLRLWPIFHVTSAVSACHLPLCVGMEMILEPEFNFTNIDEIIWKYKPEHLLLVPPLLEIIINSSLLKDKDLSFVKTVGCGGAGMPKPLEEAAVKFFKEHNMNVYLGSGYGQTENGSSAAIRMSHETTVNGSVGVPLVDTTISVFDEEMNEIRYNQEGEICIKSSNFMKGYLNDEVLTNSVIKKHKDGSLWLHTGDLGYVTEDGFVYVLGRITRTIFLQTAEKVYPDKLGEKLMLVEGVKEISVIQIPDVKHEGYFVPACCIVKEDGYCEKDVMHNLIEFCNGNVEKYAIPRDIKFVSELPHNKMGKVDIKLLEKTYYEKSI